MEWPALAERLARLARGIAGRTHAERMLLGAAAYVLAVPGAEPATATREYARRALAGGELAAEGFGSASLGFAIAALTLTDDFAGAEAAGDDALSAAVAAGSRFGFGMTKFLQAQLRYRTGDLRRSEADAAASLDAALETTPIGLASAASQLVDALVAMGRLDEAGEVLERTGLAGELPPMLTFQFLCESRGDLWLAAGEPERALAEHLEAGRRGGDSVTNPTVTRWRAGAALAHLHLGDHAEAERLAAEALDLARSLEGAWSLGMALRVRGMVARGDDAVPRLREAVEVLEGTGAAYELARARVELGSALRRRGERGEAQDHLAAGLDLAARCGARPLAERARSELHAAGARPRRELLAGVEALTARERSVADLAAAGHANKRIAQELFVSLKTVEKHLANAYRKLDISSREELPAALGVGDAAKK
jgi:ATP/maltotriose-dependent transcriptional regulator MalT